MGHGQVLLNLSRPMFCKLHL